jgi:hypothetical protein
MTFNKLSLITTIFTVLLSLVCTGWLSAVDVVENELITTIILIDRQAELVDVDLEGVVVRRHTAIPDYWSSGRSHKSSLRKALGVIKDYGLIEEDKSNFLPGSSHLPALCLQSFMLEQVASLTPPSAKKHFKEEIDKGPVWGPNDLSTSVASVMILSCSSEIEKFNLKSEQKTIIWQRRYAHVRLRKGDKVIS